MGGQILEVIRQIVGFLYSSSRKRGNWAYLSGRIANTVREDIDVLLCGPHHALAPEIAASAENPAAPSGAAPAHRKPVRMSRPSAFALHGFRGRIRTWKPDTGPAAALPLFGYRHDAYGRMHHGGSTITLLFGNRVSTQNNISFDSYPFFAYRGTVTRVRPCMRKM